MADAEVIKISKKNNTISIDDVDQKTIKVTGSATGILDVGSYSYSELKFTKNADSSLTIYTDDEENVKGIKVTIADFFSKDGKSIKSPLKTIESQILTYPLTNLLNIDYSGTINRDKKGNMKGSYFNDTIVGTDKNDKIYAYTGNDTISFGKGNDKLYIAAGKKTVTINSGDGNKTIYSTIKEGINLNLTYSEDANLSYKHNLSNNDLVITNTYTKDGAEKTETLTIKNYYKYNNDSDNTFTINNSKIDTAIENAGITIIGKSSGINVIDGTEKNDTIYAGKKINTIESGAGDDTVVLASKGISMVSDSSGNDNYITTGLNNSVVIADSKANNDESNDTLTIQKISNSDINLLFNVDKNGNHSYTDSSRTTGYSIDILNNKQASKYMSGKKVTTGVEIVDYFDDGEIENIILTDKTGRVTTQLGDGFNSWAEAITEDVKNFLTNDLLGKYDSAADVIANGTKAEKKKLYNLYTKDKKERLLSGNDIITITKGKNTVYAGAGNDTITSGTGKDTIYTGEGNDTVIISNGSGNDTIYIGKEESSSTTIVFDENQSYSYERSKNGKGNDLLITRVFTNAKNKTVTETTTVKNYFADDYQSTLKIKRGETTIDAETDIGDKGLIIRGDYEKSNKITGTDSAEVIIGGKKADTIKSGGGNDIIYAGNGNDTIYAGDGNDIIYADSGNDTIYAGNGNDVIDAGTGNDTIYAGEGTNSVIIRNGDGNDTLYLGKNEDTKTTIYFDEDAALNYEITYDGDLLIKRSYKSGKKTKTETLTVKDYENKTSELYINTMDSSGDSTGDGDKIEDLIVKQGYVTSDGKGNSTLVTSTENPSTATGGKQNNTYIINVFDGSSIEDGGGVDKIQINNLHADKLIPVFDVDKDGNAGTSGSKDMIIFNTENDSLSSNRIKQVIGGYNSSDDGLVLKNYFGTGKIETIIVNDNGYFHNAYDMDSWIEATSKKVKELLAGTKYNSALELLTSGDASGELKKSLVECYQSYDTTGDNTYTIDEADGTKLTDAAGNDSYTVNGAENLQIYDTAGNDNYIINSADKLYIHDNGGDDTYTFNKLHGTNIYEQGGGNDTLIINDEDMKVSDARIFFEVGADATDEGILIFHKDAFDSVYSNLTQSGDMAIEEYGAEIERYFTEGDGGKIETIKINNTELDKFEDWISTVKTKAEAALDGSGYTSSQKLIDAVADSIKNSDRKTFFSLYSYAEKVVAAFNTEYNADTTGDNTYNLDSDFDFTKNAMIISDDGGSDVLNINQAHDNLAVYFNVTKEGKATGELHIFNGTMTALMADPIGSFTKGVTITDYFEDGKIETIQDNAGYQISDDVISSITQNVAAFLTQKGYDDTSSFMANAGTMDLLAMLNLYAPSNNTAQAWTQTSAQAG